MILAKADAWLEDLRDRLTPGQRWTAFLALTLALGVLLFGLPTAITIRPGRAGAAPLPAPPQVATAPTTLPPAVAATFPGISPQAQPAVSAPPTPAALPALGPSPSTSPPASRVAGPVLPKVVALAQSGNTPPGASDSAMATAYLRSAPFPSTLLTLNTSDPTMCRRTLAAGSVVLASGEVGTQLRACLIRGGATILAADPEGDLLSRGTTDVLLDLAHWSGLKGRAGLVAPADRRAAVQAALAVLHPAAVAWLDPDPSGAVEIPSAVEGFSSKGVTTTVFAVPVEQQQRWFADADLLDPAMHYVVTDISDGIVNEQYPPTFAGALAYTSIRTPWYERAHGATPTQTACEKTWSAAAPLGTLTTTEVARAYAWCVAVAATAAGLQAMGSGRPFAAAVRSTMVHSALTSDLGPLPGGAFGPTENAVLAWSAGCVCWTEQTPFHPRP